MARQREQSRAGSTSFAGGGAGLRDAAATLATATEPTDFTGYGELTTFDARVTALEDLGEVTLVKLDRSPLYATGGGQVADAGLLSWGAQPGTPEARTVGVQDVVRVGEDQILVVPTADADGLSVGEVVDAQVDHAARFRTQGNHTATHLLQSALRQVVGDHVRQAGSYVGPDKLRFDFNHGTGLSADELRQVEDLVNGWIAADQPVQWQKLPIDEAKARGATALFGEKYGDVVRMVEIGDGSWSRELCGGTHVARTSEIGVFTILSESSSSANVRRIEALTGPAAVERLRGAQRLLADAADAARTQPEALVDTINGLRDQIKAAEKARREALTADVDRLLTDRDELGGGGALVARSIDIDDAKALAELAGKAQQKLGGGGAIVFGAAIEGKPSLVVALGPELVERGLNAGAVVKAAAPLMGGGGGGRPNVAQAGGKKVEGLAEAIAEARRAVLDGTGA
ncbi:MAG: DHHA1 domain-containing protein [Patulibacter minatonensis]